MTSEWARSQAAPPIHPLVVAAFESGPPPDWSSIPTEVLAEGERLPRQLAERTAGEPPRTVWHQIHFRMRSGASRTELSELWETIDEGTGITVRVARDWDGDGRPDERETRFTYRDSVNLEGRMVILMEHARPGVGWREEPSWLQSALVE